MTFFCCCLICCYQRRVISCWRIRFVVSFFSASHSLTSINFKISISYANKLFVTKKFLGNFFTFSIIDHCVPSLWRAREFFRLLRFNMMKSVYRFASIFIFIFSFCFHLVCECLSIFSSLSLLFLLFVCRW